MTREVQFIPPARRPVRWTLALSSRWPVGLTGLVMTLYGGLIALMLFYARGGKPEDDRALDEGPVLTAEARVTKVWLHRGSWLSGEPLDRISYDFQTANGEPQKGSSFAPARRYSVDDPMDVHYLEARPEINRAVGSRLCLLPDLVSPVMGFVVLPGLLLVLLWLQGAHDLRRMLATGDVAAAESVKVERVPWVIPVMLRARYRFRDRHAQWCEGRHWVPARSALGVRLTSDPTLPAVVHDRSHPEHSRLVVAPDFAPAANTRTEPQAARRA